MASMSALLVVLSLLRSAGALVSLHGSSFGRTTVRTAAKVNLRREVIGKFFGAAVAFTTIAQPTWAAPASAADIERLRKGYAGLEYLMSNFDKETTKCDPECKRSPDAVRSYLGLRSMDHPLYQAEKVLSKAQVRSTAIL